MPFYGWAVVVVATLATFCSGPGQSFVFSVFVDPILADTGLSRVYLSTLYAFGTGVSAVMVVVVARLVDRFGARLMLAGIALALGVACFGMSTAAGPVALFFGFAAMRALGQGSLPVTANILTAQWFVGTPGPGDGGRGAGAGRLQRAAPAGYAGPDRGVRLADGLRRDIGRNGLGTARSRPPSSSSATGPRRWACTRTAPPDPVREPGDSRRGGARLLGGGELA